MTRLALTLASGIILAVAGWAETAHDALSTARRAADPAAYHAAIRSSSGQSRRQPFYSVGSGSCRACHRAIYVAWAGGPHAAAGAKLGQDEMLEPDCRRCHAPLFDPDDPVMSSEVAVACEACHGPGSVYASLAVMIDPLKRDAAGLRDGRALCRDCHTPYHEGHVEIDIPAERRRIHPAPAIRRTAH